MSIWYTMLNWGHMLPPILGFFVCMRYARHTKFAVTLAAGFGLMGAVSILSRVVNTLVVRSMQTMPASSADTLTRLLPSTMFFSLVSIAAWALLVYGVYQALEEISRKEALSQLSHQSNWNYPAAPNSFQAQTTQNQQVQSPFVQTPSLQMPLTPQGQEQVREEAHAFTYVSPAAPASTVADDRPAVSVQPEQPDAPLTLGSSR